MKFESNDICVQVTMSTVINVCAIYFLCGFLQIVTSVKIDSKTVLSDKFIDTINDFQYSWRAGRNFHEDSELRNLISITDKLRRELEYVNTTSSVSLPDKFDSRKKWPLCTSIGNAKTQGNCASSYALAAASVFTDRFCVQKGTFRSSSADQVLTCCKKCGAGCFGGYIEKSFDYMKQIGLVSGGDHRSKVGCRPYKIGNCPTKKGKPLCPRIREQASSCYNWKCTNGKLINVTYETDKIKMKNVYAVPFDVQAIKSEIFHNGPVSATITVYEDFFNYKDGIYYHVHGNKVGKLDVKIIGWDRINLAVPYWLVVNSWGKNWGDKGLFKIKLGINECDIESNVLSGTFL